MLKEILKKKKRPIIVSDFDGTISTRDISYELLEHFSVGGWQGIDEAYGRGEIGSQEAFRLILERIKASKSELVQFIENVAPIDPTFPDFYRYVKEKGIDMVILSDGFEFYIRSVLEKSGITDVPIYANDIVEDESGKLIPVFPYSSAECDRCGNCKSRVIEKLKEDHDYIIFIGDGYSDLCASEVADALFAKKRLMRHAAQTRLPFTFFEDFGDIHAEFEKEIKGAIFDLDGTLVDSLEAIRTALAHTIDTLHLDLDLEKIFREMMSWPLNVSLEKIFPGVDLNEALGVFRSKYLSIYKEMTPIKPGMEDVLAYLTDSGVKLSVATNKHAPYARELIEHLGISHFFEAIIGVGDVDNPKPAPDMVDAALKHMGTKKDDTVFIGDSQVDIETAKNSQIDVYVLSDSLDTPEELAKRKPKKMFYTTAELLKELASKA